MTGRRRPLIGLESLAIHTTLTLFGFVLLVPFLWMLLTSLKDESQAYQLPPQWIPSELVWNNYYVAVFGYFNFIRYAMNSITITTGVLLGRLITASLVAFGFARIRFVGRGVLFILVLSGLMVPHQVTIVPLYIIFKELGWLNTYLPLIVPTWLGGGAFYIFLLRQFLLGISTEIDDAAKIDGCNWFDIYWRISMPLIKPALAAVAIFSFLQTWDDFFGPLIFLRSNDLFTLPIGLHFYSEGSASSRPVITVAMAATTLIMTPPLAVFVAAQRYFIRGVVFNGLKG
jgi:ABC-type glycerol-3-phosphate transport system permease component